MRNGVRWTRRVTAVISLLLVALVVTGPGAGAAGIQNYSAQASGTTLSVNVSLPLANVLSGVLGNTGVNANSISERISFSNATADVAQSQPASGTALGQVFFGSLDPLLLQVSRLVGYTASKLPEAAARVGGSPTAHSSLLAVDLPDATTKLIHVGVAEANASAKTVNGLVQSHSQSSLADISVNLTNVLKNPAIQGVLQPVEQQVDNLLPQVNGLLGQVEGTVKQVTGVDVNLNLPNKIEDVLNKPLLAIDLITSISDTGFKGAVRFAHGQTRLANVDILGGLIHLDALVVDTYAQIDGTKTGAQPTYATQRILGLKVGGNVINLNTGSLQVLGKTIQLPVDLTKLLNLTVDALGLSVSVAPTPQIVRSADHSRAAASTLHIGLAPSLAGAKLFSVAIDGPAAVADVQGSNVQGVRFVHIPTTGLGDDTLWLGGFAILGLALAARRFALSR